MVVYYNENDPYAAQWLCNLIAAGHIAPGDVDERSIVDVRADDLKGYTQCHFFAGIGGWSYALRLAGWDDARPVWTGSCPCQPFSVAGKQKGQADDRHLWPIWFGLIKQCRPTTVFGEQVAGAIAKGWLDGVYDDMETEGYAVGAAVLPACSVGAPHKRDRLWFVGYSQYNGSPAAEIKGIITAPSHDYTQGEKSASKSQGAGRSRGSQVMADSNDNTSARFGQHGGEILSEQESIRSGSSGESLANSTSWSEQRGGSQCNEWGLQEEILRESQYTHDWNTEPSVGRVADGIPARSHKLRAYGNAIVPQVAAEFIKATM